MVLALGLASGALAADKYSETLTLNSGSAFVSANTYKGQIAISCDGEVRQTECAASSGCAATTTSAKLSNFDLPVDVCVGTEARYVSLIRTGSSTVTCYIYKVAPITNVCK